MLFKIGILYEIFSVFFIYPCMIFACQDCIEIVQDRILTSIQIIRCIDNDDYRNMDYLYGQWDTYQQVLKILEKKHK